ncbi:MAG: hypothetical protein WCC60_04540, partial [Ilumatobacteraceae bacterium]
MSTDTDERFGHEIGEQLRHIAADLVPRPDLDTMSTRREAAHRRRRSAARTVSGVALAALLVGGIAWVTG